MRSAVLFVSTALLVAGCDLLGSDPDGGSDVSLSFLALSERGTAAKNSQVTGSWTSADSSSRSFTSRSSDFDVAMELRLNPPLEVEAGTTSNLTGELRLGSWFRKDDGGLFDPAAGIEGGNYDGEAEDHIDDAFDAFEDTNEDGDPDSDED